MKNLILSALAVILLLAAPAKADHVGFDMSATSPSTVTTSVGYTLTGDIGMFNSCAFYVVVQGATGGTLDIYIQTAVKKLNASPTWVDVAHLAQLAAAAPAAAFAFTLTRWTPTSPVITGTLNTVSGTPLLPVNTIVPGLLGYQLRVVFKTGAGTTLGAAQVILAYCSST